MTNHIQLPSDTVSFPFLSQPLQWFWMTSKSTTKEGSTRFEVAYRKLSGAQERPEHYYSCLTHFNGLSFILGCLSETFSKQSRSQSCFTSTNSWQLRTKSCFTFTFLRSTYAQLDSSSSCGRTGLLRCTHTCKKQNGSSRLSHI